LTGEDALAFRKELDQHYIPNKIVLGGMEENLPLLENRISPTKTHAKSKET